MFSPLFTSGTPILELTRSILGIKLVSPIPNNPLGLIIVAFNPLSMLSFTTFSESIFDFM